MSTSTHTCATSADRLTAWCWRRNDVGQVGDGSTGGIDAVNPTPTIVEGQRPE